MANNGAGKCAKCKVIAQRFKGSDSKLYCADCYYKIFGVRPTE